MMIKKIKRIFASKNSLVEWLTNRKISRLIPDTYFVVIKYRAILGRWPNLKNPKYLSEKIQWLKLYDRKELYTRLVDKYEVRNYIKEIIGEEYLVPLLGVWDNPEEIDWSTLPKKFVLKCTHGSHTNIICTDKNTLDKNKTLKQLKLWLNDESTFYYGREWPYKLVKPRIIAETFIESNHKGGLVDYKFMCFDGCVDNVMVCSNRQTGNTQFDHFDRNWNLLRYQYVDADKPLDYTVSKPNQIQRMFEMAEILSRPFPFVRVDLYCEKDCIYFGEMTFYPQSGYDTDYTVETDLYLGNKLKLPKGMN